MAQAERQDIPPTFPQETCCATSLEKEANSKCGILSDAIQNHGSGQSAADHARIYQDHQQSPALLNWSVSCHSCVVVHAMPLKSCVDAGCQSKDFARSFPLAWLALTRSA